MSHLVVCTTLPPGRGASHAVLARLVGRLLHIPYGRVAVERDAWRRPYVVDGDTGERLPLDVNIGHTADVLVIGVSCGHRIGVDVERVDRPIVGDGADTATMLRKVCHETEIAALAPLAPAARTAEISRLWTCKEAVAKADGRGLAIDLASIRVAQLPSGWAVRAVRMPHPARRGPDCWVAVARCATGPGDPVAHRGWH